MRKGIKKCLLFMIICMFLLQYTLSVQATEDSGGRNTMTASSKTALKDFQDVDGQILEDFEDREIMWICQEDNITVVACDASSDDAKSIQEQTYIYAPPTSILHLLQFRLFTMALENMNRD